MKEPPEFPGHLNSHITRRQAIKAGGIAVVGLVFAGPIINTLQPRSAFAVGGSYQLSATGPATSSAAPTGSPSMSLPTAAPTAGQGASGPTV